MTARLNPIIHERLLRFGSRRARLRVTRRAAIALSIAILAVLAAVVLDAVYLLANWHRWALSIAVYSVVAAAIVWVGRKFFASRETMTDLARSFELVDPRLREQLLSAVELSSASETGSSGSAGFREHLQRQVAKAIEPADVILLLPWQLVKRWVWTAVCALGLVLLLSLIPQLHFPQRVVRTLLPAANLARHSTLSIEIVQPATHIQTIARGDVMAVVASVTGGEPASIALHTRTSAGAGISQAMFAIDGSNDAYETMRANRDDARLYQTNLTADAVWIEFRIVADDAFTAWRRISTQPRPKAIQFEKRIQLPAYSGASDLVRQDDHGDIEALSGSLVSLAVRSDAPLAAAWIDWQATDERRTLSSQPLEIVRDSITGVGVTAKCQFPVAEDRTYRLTLRAADTGFENSFSPTYTLRALPDKSPRIRWNAEAIAHTGAAAATSSGEPLTMIVRPDFMADMSAIIEDEFPVAKLSQLTRVNLREWNESALDAPSEPVATARWKMDLLPRNLKAGDILQTKLVAVDLKGQIAESAVLELVISTAGFDRHRHHALRLRRQVADAVHEFSLNVHTLATPVGRSKISAEPASHGTFASSVGEQSAALREKIGDVSRQLEDPVSLSELERVGQVLMSIEFAMLPEFTSEAKPQNASSTPGQHAGVEADGERKQRIDQTAKRLDELFYEFHAHDAVAALSHDLRVLVELQQSLSERAGEMNEEQMRREQAVIGRHFREIERLMIEQTPIFRGEAARQLEQWSLWFANYAEYIEEGTEEHSLKERVERLAKTVSQQLAQRPPISTIDVMGPVRLTSAHKEIDELCQPLFHSVAALGSPLKSSVDPGEHGAARLRIDQLRPPELEQLAARRRHHLFRADADRAYASDLGNVDRAVGELLGPGQWSAPEAADGVHEIAAALGTLEAIHQVAEAGSTLAALLLAERWEVGSWKARIEHPRWWDAVRRSIEHSIARLRGAGVPNEPIAELNRLLSSKAAERVSQRVSSRRWSADQPSSAAAELEELEKSMRDVQHSLAAIAAGARQIIAKYAPSVSQLAERAAEETRRLKQKTEVASQQLSKDDDSFPGDGQGELLRQRERIDQPTSDLRDALADTAGVMDLLAREELEKARDADTAVSIVDEVKRRVDESLGSALENPLDATSTQDKLEKAIAQQQQAIEALSRIAEHFAPRDASDSPRLDPAQEELAWRSLERRMRADEAMKRQYSKAEKLSKLAQSDPRSLLKQLEREMNNSLSMRAELSRIARETTRESIATLQQAAQRERDLNIGLEDGDPEFRVQKQLLHAGLMAANARAAQLGSTLVSEAKSAAMQSPQLPSTAQLAALEAQLREFTSSVQSLTLRNSQDEIIGAAQSLEAALGQFKRQLESAASSLAQASKQAAYESAQELRNRRREVEERLRRVWSLVMRDAVQNVQSEQHRLDQAESELRGAQQSARPNTQQPARPDATANQLVEVLQFKVQELSARVKRAQEARQQIEVGRQSPSLNSPNPVAEVAALFAKNAAESSADIAGSLAQLLKNNVAPDSLLASQNSLARGQHDQQAVEDSVAQVGENLARAARHEGRLQNQMAASQLRLLSERISVTAAGEVRQAKQSLERALANARQATVGNPRQADAQSTAESRKSLEAAEKAIRQRADEASAILSPAANASRNDSAASGENVADNDSQQESNSPMDATRMARMLDELDRQLNGRSSQADKNGQSPSPPTSEPPPSSSLAEAARQLASDMTRGRQAKDSYTSKSGPLTSTSRASSSPAPPSQVRVIDASRGADGAWGELRQQRAEQVSDSLREAVAPQYRQQVETYFRVLSEQSSGQSRAPRGTAP